MARDDRRRDQSAEASAELDVNVDAGCSPSSSPHCWTGCRSRWRSKTPRSTPSVAYDIAMRFAERELDLPSEKPARRSAPRRPSPPRSSRADGFDLRFDHRIHERRRGTAMEHPHRVVRADAVHRGPRLVHTEPGPPWFGTSTTSACRSPDVDVHLRARAQVDHLSRRYREWRCGPAERRTPGLQRDALGTDDDGRRARAAPTRRPLPRAGCPAPSRPPTRPTRSSTSASKMLAEPRNPATNVVAGCRVDLLRGRRPVRPCPRPARRSGRSW